MRKICFLLILAIAAVTTGGCTITMKDVIREFIFNDDTENESTQEQTQAYELDERQKEILQEQGLSTDYDELLPSQKRAIKRIRVMLEYAEEKYGIEFCYAGYVASYAGVEKEHMYAYPKGGDDEDDKFTITATDDGFEDDYVAVASADMYNEYITQAVQSLAPDAEMIVETSITSCHLENVPDAPEEFDGTTGAAIYIYLDGETFEHSQFDDFLDRLDAYLIEHELTSKVRIVLLKEGIIEELTGYNYSDYLPYEENYYEWETIYID